MKIAILQILFGAMLSASSLFYLTDGSQCTGGCGPSPFGTVTLTQSDAQDVQVLVTLDFGDFFVQTGGPHRSFAFSIQGDPAISLAALSAGFAFSGASAPDAGYGTFGYAITGPAPGDHCCSTLSFSVARQDHGNLSVGDFVANATGAMFEADIFSGVTGNTGEVAAVAESPAWRMVAVGLLLLGAVERLTRRLA